MAGGWLAFVLIALALAGCTSAPAALTIDQAKAAYGAAAGAYNQTLDAAKAAWTDEQSLAQGTAFYATLAPAEQTFIDALKAPAWPAAVAPDMDALVKALVVLHRSQVQASKATTREEFAGLAVDLDRQTGQATDLAAIVRDELGLPPNA